MGETSNITRAIWGGGAWKAEETKQEIVKYEIYPGMGNIKASNGAKILTMGWGKILVFARKRIYTVFGTTSSLRSM
jgi:hypothetical protein